MIGLPPRSTPLYSSAASDVYKRQREGIDGSRRSPTVELAEPTSDKLLVPQRLDRVEAGGTPGREVAEHHADECRESECDEDDRWVYEEGHLQSARRQPCKAK